MTVNYILPTQIEVLANATPLIAGNLASNLENIMLPPESIAFSTLVMSSINSGSQLGE